MNFTNNQIPEILYLINGQYISGTEESEQETDRLIEDSNISGCGISRICDPESLCHRLIALTLMSLLGFGAYFCMDNPGALQVITYAT